MDDFSPLSSHPTCTHREITAYSVASTGEPVAFWACAHCGRRFAPIEPNEESNAADYAGSLTGVFGTAEETLEFIRGERDSWDE
jgi:hypothetical protein